MLERLLPGPGHQTGFDSRRPDASGIRRARCARRARSAAGERLEVLAALARRSGTGRRRRRPARAARPRPRPRAARAAAIACSRSPQSCAGTPAAPARRGAARLLADQVCGRQRSATAATQRRVVLLLAAAAEDRVDPAGERADADDGRGDVGRLGVVDVEDALDARRPPPAGARRRRTRAAPRATAAGSTPRASATAAAAIAFSRLCAPRSRISARGDDRLAAPDERAVARPWRRPSPAAASARLARGRGPGPAEARGQHGERVRVLVGEDAQLRPRGRRRSCRGGRGGPARG